jgi:hypothetical protein
MTSMNKNYLSKYTSKFVLVAVCLMATPEFAKANLFLETIDKKILSAPIVKAVKSRLVYEVGLETIDQQFVDELFYRFLYQLRCENNSLEHIQSEIDFLIPYSHKLGVQLQQQLFFHASTKQKSEMDESVKVDQQLIKATLAHRRGDYAGVIKLLSLSENEQGQRLRKTAQQILETKNKDTSVLNEAINEDNFAYFKWAHYNTKNDLKEKFIKSLDIDTAGIAYQSKYILTEISLTQKDWESFDKYISDLEDGIPYYSEDLFWPKWLRAVKLKMRKKNASQSQLKCSFTRGLFADQDVAADFLESQGDNLSFVKGRISKETNLYQFFLNLTRANAEKS